MDVKDRTILSLAAIIAVTVLETFALYLGIDGVLFAAVIGAIGTFAGYTIGKNGLKQSAAIPAVIGGSITLDTQGFLIIIGFAGVIALGYLGYRLSHLPQMVAKGILGSIARLARSTGTGDDAQAFSDLGQSLERAWKGDDGAILSVLTNPITLRAYQKLQPLIQKFGGQLKLGGQEQPGGFAGD